MFREQQRAKAAYEAVDAVKDEKWKDAYGGLCLRLPPLIQTNGLCLAIAFLESKGKVEMENRKPEHERFLNDVAIASGVTEGRKALAKQAREADTGEYMRLTEEVMRCATYFKRYAEAVLKVEATSLEKGLR